MLPILEFQIIPPFQNKIIYHRNLIRKTPTNRDLYSNRSHSRRLLLKIKKYIEKLTNPVIWTTMKKLKTYVTSDIGIAAYLQLVGVNLLQCKRLDNGKFYFEFDQPDLCKEKSIEFLSSDFCKFDNHVRNLKKILFS